MKNSILLVAFLMFTQNPFAVASDSGILAEVSFEHVQTDKYKDVFYDSETFVLRLFDDGMLEIENYRNVETVWPGYSLVEQLDDDQFMELADLVSVLGNAELETYESEFTCMVMPSSSVPSDLLLLTYHGEFQTVLSDEGCWREFFVYPVDPELLELAKHLKQRLIELGAFFLDR
ncbi:MAG: hypothetical protein OXB88_02305 [Bacteriovoracales bacterium]|nr:hypothetical protein [Bacteriovoracales bacterium]